MKWIKASLVTAAALAAAGGAQAAGVGVRAGTTGIGGDVGFSLMPTLVRAPRLFRALVQPRPST